MAVTIRDPDLEQKLDRERRLRFNGGGTLARVLRDIAREHFLRREMSGQQDPKRDRRKQPA